MSQEQARREENAQLYSDVFKDSNGFRPKGSLFTSFTSKSLEAQDAELQQLSDEVSREVDTEIDEAKEVNVHFFSTVEAIQKERGQGFRDAVLFYFFQNGQIESIEAAEEVSPDDVEFWLFMEGTSPGINYAVSAEMFAQSNEE